jgi:hypothetical protein
MTEAQYKKFQELEAAYEARWAELGKEKRSDLNFSDSEIDRLSHEMFMIVSGGKNVITFSEEQIINAAERQER